MHAQRRACLNTDLERKDQPIPLVDIHDREVQEVSPFLVVILTNTIMV